MRLNDDQKKQLADFWKAANGGPILCPTCGGKDLAAAEINGALRVAESGRMELAEGVLWSIYIPIVCKSCAHVMLFDPKTAGIDLKTEV